MLGVTNGNGLKMSREENDVSEQPTSSDPGHSLHLMRKIEEFERRLNILEGKMPLMVTNTVCQEIKPAAREEFQKLLTEGTRNEVAEERSLHLKFLDEVSGPVQTSKEFRAVTDGPLKVALFDATGNIVNSGHSEKLH